MPAGKAVAQTAEHLFPLIEVEGTSYEMGYQHGAQARELVGRYLLWIDRLTGRPRDELCRNAMTFVPYIEALSPAMIEEMRGLADGAGISFEEAALCQARAEAAQVGEGGCTAFALSGEATAGGAPLAGQNQDLEPEYADVAVLLRVKPSDGRPRALMFTFAGQLGFSAQPRTGASRIHRRRDGQRRQPGRRSPLDEPSGVHQAAAETALERGRNESKLHGRPSRWSSLTKSGSQRIYRRDGKGNLNLRSGPVSKGASCGKMTTLLLL